MANQIIIDIGAVANDGTGDPLRTAFGYVNNNFSNIWNTGVANSNISFSGNRILTTNTNGNLVLAPNGVGKVQANVDIVPNANNTLNLGSLTYKWNTVYAQYLEVGSEINLGGDLTVTGNLTVEGDTIQIGNIVTDTKTIQLANTASTANAANGSGITVGANDNIATMLYSSSANVWATNIGISATGNITGTYFVGNGALLTGITSYGNADVAAYLPTYTGNLAGGNLSVSNAGNTWTIEGQYLTGPGGAYWHSHPEQSVDEFVGAPGSNIRLQSVNANSVVESQINLTGTNIVFTVDNGISRTWRFNETGVTEFPKDITPVVAGGGTADIGNVTNPWTNAYFSGSVFSGNIIPNTSNTYSLGNATNQWSDLYVSNATIYMNGVPISLSAGNVLTVNGEAVLSNDSNTNITTTGTIDAEILTANTTVNIGTGAIGIGDDDYLVVETLVPGGFRPSNDDTYNLGNVSHRWAEVHANVYYGDGSQLTGLSFTSISNDGSIVDIVVPNGDVTITANSTQTWTFDTNGDLTVPNYVQFAGNTIIGDEPGAGTPYFRIDTPLGYPATITTDADISGNNWSWTFGADGNLTLPTNKSIIVDGGDGVIGPVSDDMVISWDNEEIRLVSVQGSIEMQADNAFRVQTNYDGGTDTYLSRWEFNQDEIVNITGPSAIVTEAGNLTLSGGRNGLASGNVSVVAVNNGVSVSTWTFVNDGSLTAPGSITASSTVSGLTLVSTQSAANEGGEIQLSLPSSGTALTGNIIIDSYQNQIRLFESGNTRGVFVDIPNVSVSGQYAIGYRDVPQIELSGNVTANSITAGKHFYSTTAGNLQVTIPDNANVAFPTGATLTIVMNAAGNVIVAQGTGVSLYMAGSSSTGNRTVGAYGLASVMKVATDTWVISGTGVY